jgi:hypothetical protein
MNLNQNQQAQNQNARLRHEDTLSADWDTVPERVVSERVSESEMREVMALYDAQIGIHTARPEAREVKEAVAGRRQGAGEVTQDVQPTIADVAEILGISTTEAQRLLGDVRARDAAEAASSATARGTGRRVPTPPQYAGQPSVVPPLNTTPATPPVYGSRTTVQQVAPGQRVTVGPGQHVTVAPGQQVTIVQQTVVDSHAYLFEKFNQNGGAYVPTWNWGPFFFLWLWYFYKGMWLKGFLFMFLEIIAAVATAGTSLLPMRIALGFLGNYDYYLLRCHGSQGWDRRPQGYLPTTTYITNATGTDPRYNAGSFQQQPQGQQAFGQQQEQARQTPTTTPPRQTQPQAQTRREESAPTPASKFQLLREGYERGLFTREEYEEKRLVLLRELENQDNLRKLEEALRMGLLTAAEYEQKRENLLNGK